MDVFIKRAKNHDVPGMPDAYAVCVRGLVPGVKTSQPAAIVWGRDMAERLAGPVKESLTAPAKPKPKRKKKAETPVAAAPQTEAAPPVTA